MDNGKLTKAEARQLAKYEKAIRDGLQSFIDVGRALLAIREEQLYLSQANTFDDYCRQKWGWSRSYACKLIRSMEAADDVAEVETPMGTMVPANERVAREIAALDSPEQRADVWSKAVESSGNGKVTAAQVREVREELYPASDPEPAPAEDRLKSMVSRLETLADDLTDISAACEKSSPAWQRVLTLLTDAQAAIRGLEHSVRAGSGQ